jgi:hypothetical protein
VQWLPQADAAYLQKEGFQAKVAHACHFGATLSSQESFFTKLYFQRKCNVQNFRIFLLALN